MAEYIQGNVITNIIPSRSKALISLSKFWFLKKVFFSIGHYPIPNNDLLSFNSCHIT